ncbi:LamG-like jellyroll fold domain-containing protein [Streptomyces sp. sk226]|uniref:LamG-like jellyroll fold domain-containing protein n=1 Tax=Streptomyces sp. sk226 TaxID=2034268 RepID=UPI000BF1FD41|nr:LamG-like jellyroll fold domain-containing protein [Streptomyces sp. sk226]
MRRAVRGGWGKVIGLALAVVLAVGSLALAATGFPLLPERPAPAEGPDQRWGSAEGLGHDAGGPANTRPPTSLRAAYPLRAPKTAAPSAPPNTAEVAEPPAPPVTGFDAATSTEIVAERDARSRTYANEDGTRTTEISTTPINYRDKDGGWRAVDTTLVGRGESAPARRAAADAPADGWTTTADSVRLTLAPRADSPRLALLTLPSGASFGYGLEGAADAPGNARENRVSYEDVLPETDLWLDAQAGGVKETLVLRSADAPADFSFPLTLRGLTASERDGGIVLTDDDGKTAAVIPAGFMTDARGATSYGVRYRLAESRDGTPTLHVSADRDWLGDPDRAFPVHLDPSVDTGAASTSMYVRDGGPSVVGSAELQTGRSPSGATHSYLGFPGLDEKLRHHRVFGAQLQLVNFDSASCKPRPVSVHPVTQAWGAGTGTSYPGPSVGGALATKSFAYGHIAFGQSSSACPPAGELFNLGKAGRDLVQRWTDGTQPNYGLSLRASATDPLSFKKFTGHATANPPKLYVTHSPYSATYAFPKPVPDPPVLQNQAGKVKVTVTNTGAEAWTPGGYYLAYRAYDAKSKLVTQQRAANLTGNVARGGKTTLEATIKALPPGAYLLDFTMVRTGGKVFIDEQVPPGRLTLQVFDIAPVIKEQFPPNGYQAQTLTPQLWASGVDIDAPPGSALQYKYEICEADEEGEPTACTTSPYQTASAYPVPAGRLKWGTTYLWRGFVKDASNEVPTARVALVAAVPQPEITSRLSATPGKEFDPNAGNFTSAAVDATITSVGPDLGLVRTYNSLDPRRDLAFGAGWSTRYDMRLTPDDDGTGNVVIRYPDGQDVRFGKNPDGSFAPPPGRFAKLTLDTAAGTYRLQDKSGTLYEFSTGGLLARITDASSNAVTYTWSGGKIQRAVHARSGRSLTFTWTGAHVTSVSTNPVDGAPLTWTYTYTGDVLDKVCDPTGGCTRYAYTSGSHYGTTVLDARPASYWKLGESEGTTAESAVEANLGKDRGTATDVTLKAAGAITGDPGTAAGFNGSTSRVTLPSGTLKKSRDLAVEVWFKTPATGVGGPLVGYQDKAWGTAPGVGVPALYVGTDGKLRGQFWTGSATPITDTTKNVNDGSWHHAVLSVSGTTQSLYLDGKLSGTLSGKQLAAGDLTHNQIGAARVPAPAAWPGWGAAAARSFAGTIDDVAVYHHPLGAPAVAAHHREGTRAADVLTRTTLPSGRTASEVSYDTARDRVREYTDRNGGTWEIGTPAVFGDDDDLRRTVEVHDPVDSPYFYEYDGLTSRMLRYGEPMALGARDSRPTPSPSGSDPPGRICTEPDPGDPAFCTNPPGDGGSEPDFIRHPADGVAIRLFTYDDHGNQTGITSENGDQVSLGYDDRGNVVRRTTCRTKDDCQTAHTHYPAPAGDLDLRSDQPSATLDGRSSGPTDTRYRTRYEYDARGLLTLQTAADGGTVKNTYTTGAEPAIGGGNTPTGLPLTTTDPRGKTTRYQYFSSGDLARITEPSGLVTQFTYDALGRKLTETEISDAHPAGTTTTLAYDKLSRLVSTTEPATTNAVTLARHQQRTVTAYDADGNTVRTEVGDVFGGDEPRSMTFEADEHGRPAKAVDAEGNETSYGYDSLGNRTSMVDANGNHFQYVHTARNMMAEVRLRDWDDDGGNPDYTVLQSYAYDMGGRVVRDTDSMGRTVLYDYYGDDLVKSLTLKDFRDPDGTRRDIVVEANTYDGAGNVLTEKAYNGSVVTEYSYDAVGRTRSEVTDPGGLARRTTFTYDLAGNVVTTASSGSPSNVPWPVSATPETVRYGYDQAGNVEQETVENGTEGRTTRYTHDQRGLVTSSTDAGGHRTDYAYDEAGRTLSVTAPPVATESGGGPATTTRPTTYTGYDTFGAVTESVDALGNVNRTSYDRLGRSVKATAPAYRAPGATGTVTPSTARTYDALGNVLTETDPLGRTTEFTYDRQNRLLAKDVPVGEGDERARWAYTYTRTGQLLTVTDPTGARAESTYDDLDRPVTTTRIERRPQPGAFTTRNEYDDAGNVVKQTAPGGGVSLYSYDKLGQLLRMTDPAGVVSQYGYDLSGREVRATDGMGRTSAKLYDALGQLRQDSDLDAANSPLRKVDYGYDTVGNLTSATDPRGRTTRYAYDALGRLSSQTEPVSATESITTSFGYDALGNRTRYTDGRGNQTVYTVNALGLPESVVEPATARHPAPEDRTWTTAYDALGQPVKVTAPGGVVRERAYDRAGLLTRESGGGAEAATPARTFGYDAVGRTTRASTPEGDNTYAYDDRGSLISAAGPSGEATYAYDSDGQLTSRTDAAGTANFGYARRQLVSATDPLTGGTQTYRYDGSGAIKEIGYGAGQSRSFAYDALGRLDTDTITGSTGGAIASADYGYDADDHLTSKKTTGIAKAGENTYGYDDAGRLTSWTSDGETTEYRWDKSGNRTGDGEKTAAYDERNRLLSDGDYTYSHTARGTLATRTSSGLTEEFTFDAFDRLTKAGESGTAYTYDALDRVATRNGAEFSYAGFAPDPVKDNNSTYGRGASDELLSVAEGTGDARLTVTDKHGDVVGDLSATDGAATRLTGSAAFDPFGQRSEAGAQEPGTVGNAGFQGDWTDPDTGQVNMGARWYDPATGVFDSRDSYTYASGASILANRYTYGAGAPLDYSDPDGNWPSCIFCKKTMKKALNKIKGNKYVRAAVKTAKYVYKAVSYVVRNPVSALRKAVKFAGKVVSHIARKSGLTQIWNAGVRAVKSLGRTTGVTEWARQKAAEARKKYHEVRAQITRKARAAADFVAKHNPVPAIMAAAKPLLVVAVAVVTADPNLPAILVGVANNVIADVAKAADDIRAAVVAEVGAVVETVRDAVDWGAVWDGVKTVGNVVGEVTGFNDIRACVTTGDMEACAWAVATVAGVALGGAGAGLVRAAKAGRMAAKAAKYGEKIEKASDTLDRVETAVECSRLAADAVGNSFLAGTDVVMADGTRRPIEKVKAGDEVRATDPTTGRTSTQEVTATITGEGFKQLVRLALDTDGDRGDATEILTATAGHPFWVPSLKEWRTADELEPGQWLETGSGTRVQIEAVSAWTQRAAVYNLTVDTAHTYYVAAGATPVLVHNCGPDTPVKLFRSPQKGNRASEARGLNRDNHTATDAKGRNFAYLGDSHSVVRQYAGQGVYEDGYHAFTMKPGFLDEFHPSAYRRFHDNKGGLQWIIEDADFDDFNSFIDHDKTEWVRWKKGVDF